MGEERRGSGCRGCWLAGHNAIIRLSAVDVDIVNSLVKRSTSKADDRYGEGARFLFSLCTSVCVLSVCVCVSVLLL